MRSISILIFVFFILNYSRIIPQDRGVFVDYKNNFYEKISEGIKSFENKEIKKSKSFQLDFSKINAPKKIEDFKVFWHQESISQGNTGTCWSFSATSFYESEIYRTTGRKINISEMYTAYYEFIDKAMEFVRTRGKSVFAEGSQANALNRVWKKYGVVPAEVYSGMLEGQVFHNHGPMYEEMMGYLKSIKENNAWGETTVKDVIISILNKYMGKPPTEFIYEGKKYTPETFFKDVVKINFDDYVEVLSIKQDPYFKYTQYRVRDNWWFDSSYYNIPLEDFMERLHAAVENGYSVCIGGDVSEPGINGNAGLAVIPSFDIPSEFINEDARQYRFSNGTTDDDHGIHIVGYTKIEDTYWYLVKDSGSGARNNDHSGYYFYRDDFVKLKMLGYLVHKDIMRDLLEKVN